MRTRALVGGWAVLGLGACGDGGSATEPGGPTETGATVGAPTSTLPTGSTASDEAGPEATTTATTNVTTTTTAGTTTAGDPVCGDGVVDAGEACDDGNQEDRDGCSNACEVGYIPDPATMGLDLPGVVPVLRVDVGGQEVMKDVDVFGTIEVFEAHAGTLMDLDMVAPTLSAQVGFQGRGNFTWTLPKKGYAFELQDAMGADLEAEIMGLPAGSDFALYACYTDKTCMRNALVFALGQRLGRWNPRTRFVELILNGEYMGLYMLWERIRRDPTRCDVDKPAKTMAEGDLSGGYIFRHEGGGKGPEVVDGFMYERDFMTSSGRVYTYHYPDADKISAEQMAFLKGYVQSFEDAMMTDPGSYADRIDVLSWVDHGILEEWTNNWDGYVHSIYMTKEADEDGGRFGMGPLWDFDLAFANGNVTGYNCQTDNWAYQISRPYPDDVPTYWLSLYADPEFQRIFKCRWQELRGEALTHATVQQQIDAWVAFTADARVRDQMRWATEGQMIFPNCFSMPTIAEEIAGLMTWIDARVAWLDAQTAAMPGTCP